MNLEFHEVCEIVERHTSLIVKKLERYRTLTGTLDTTLTNSTVKEFASVGIKGAKALASGMRRAAKTYQQFLEDELKQCQLFKS